MGSVNEEKTKLFLEKPRDPCDIPPQQNVQHVKVIFPQSVKARELRRSMFHVLLGITLFISVCFVSMVFINLIRNEKYSSDCDRSLYNFIMGKMFDNMEQEGNRNNGPTCSLIPDLEKFDCFPEPNSNEDGCLQRGCCWQPLKSRLTIDTSEVPLGVPYCFYPKNYKGYQITSSQIEPNNIYLELHRYGPSGFPNDLEDITIKVIFINNESLDIEIRDATKKRFEVPLINLKKFREENEQFRRRRSINLQYKVDFDQERLWITRISSGKIIFDLNFNQLVYADQMIQASVKLPSHHVYGIGEAEAPFPKNTSWSRYVLFNRDRAPVPNYNLYGSHPFYLVMEDNSTESSGNSHGVLLLNSNAMEIVLQPTPAITFRPIGGIVHFLINTGPSPSQVIQQYTRAIGFSFMPPYWSLGFHLCRFGLHSTNDTRNLLDRNRKLGIPIDIMWNDIDYMNSRNDFTLGDSFSDLPEFVNDIHNEGMHYILMIDPAISNAETPGTYPPYDEGVKEDIFIKNTTDQILVGKVWNKVTSVFPDFTNPAIIRYWSNQFKRFHNIVPFDGAWIDMNEPSNFVDGSVDGCPKDSTLENPPFVPGNIEPLRSKTLCMSAKQSYSSHYNLHNVYGLMETIATNVALTQTRFKRPFIISRSTFPSQGHFGGHWDGDIFSTWKDMRWTIPSILNMNMFGISMVGADICGFNGNTTKELCARWSSLGAFYPFARNHNSDDNIDQDPAALGEDVIRAARNALQQRYFLLPYLYTLFSKTNQLGETVARPLMFEFPKDKNTYAVDSQFLWGPGLMIVPVLEEGATEVEAYLPAGIWYDLRNGTTYSSDEGTRVTFQSAIDEITLLIRGGHILPGQKHEMTTTQSRKNNFTLLVGLGSDKKAKGSLYWDDGDSLETHRSETYSNFNFEANGNELTTTVGLANYKEVPDLGTVVIYGVDKPPTSCQLNGRQVEYFYNQDLQVLHCVKLGGNMFQRNTITWQ